MTDAISYKFFAPPQDVKQKMRQAGLTGNEYKVMDTIVDLVVSWSEGRKFFRKELSCSYIAMNLDLCETSVARAIKGLIRKGFLKVFSAAKKGVGRVIQIIWGENDQSKLQVKTASQKGNDQSKLQVKTASMKESINIKTNKEQETPAPDPRPNVVSSLINKLKEAINPTPKEESLKEIREKLFSKNSSGGGKSPAPQGKGEDPEPRAKEAAARKIDIPGLSETASQAGIEILRRRNLDPGPAIEEIKLEMAGKNIEFPDNYFLKLCRDKTNFSAASLEKKEYRDPHKFLERQKEIEETGNQERLDDPISEVENLKSVYPEAIEAVISEVSGRPMMNFFSPETRARCYIAEFKKKYSGLPV